MIIQTYIMIKNKSMDIKIILKNYFLELVLKTITKQTQNHCFHFSIFFNSIVFFLKKKSLLSLKIIFSSQKHNYFLDFKIY